MRARHAVADSVVVGQGELIEHGGLRQRISVFVTCLGDGATAVILHCLHDLMPQRGHFVRNKFF